MKLQDQVCGLEQAKRLKEIGVSQDAFFSWFGDEQVRLMDNGQQPPSVGAWLFVANTVPVNNQQRDHREDVCITNAIGAAFTVAELGVMVPANEMGQSYLDPERREGTTEADARASLLIHLLESGVLNVDEVNNRLNNVA